MPIFAGVTSLTSRAPLFAAGSCGSPRPDELQIRHEPQRRTVTHRVSRRERVHRDPAMPLTKRDAKLAARQMRAETPMDPTTECDVAVHRAVESDLERVGVLRGIE